MRISCPKDILMNSLQTALKTVATKSTMPVLSGIRLKGESAERVELASTDMEISLRLTMEAQVEGEEAVVVPGRLFTDVVRSLPAGKVEIGFDEQKQLVEISSGAASFKMNCLPAADFPRLPDMEEEETFEIDREPLMNTINTVSRAASSDETRPVLTGVLVKFNKDHVKMVATDSYRLSVKETKTGSTLSGKKEMVVPKSSLEELARLCSQSGDEKVTVGTADGQVMFSTGGALLTSRLIEGQFPNYQQLLPEEFEHEIKFDREEMLEVVSRVGLMAQKNAPLKLRFREGELVMSAETPQVGEASESLPVAFQGEEVEVGFNPEFLNEGIESVAEEEAFIRIISPLRPGLVKGSGDDFLYLIMPVRLTG